MRTMFKILSLLILLLITATTLYAKDEVVTIYFAGTSATSLWKDPSVAKWGASLFSRSYPNNPELVATLYDEHKRSKPAGVADEDWGVYFIDGVAAKGGVEDPSARYCAWGEDVGQIAAPMVDGCRSWWDIFNDAKEKLDGYIADHPDGGENIILNLVGWSRGGAAAIIFDNWFGSPWSHRIKKINILAFDPVVGDLLMLPNHLVLPEKIGQYVAFYAEDERSFAFDPLFPWGDPAKMRLYSVRGAHETLVGNRMVYGHTDPLFWLWWKIPYYGTNAQVGSVYQLTKAVAQEFLGSTNWGGVRLDQELYWHAGVGSEEGAKERLLSEITVMNDYKDWGRMHEHGFTPDLQVGLLGGIVSDIAPSSLFVPPVPCLVDCMESRAFYSWFWGADWSGHRLVEAAGFLDGWPIVPQGLHRHPFLERIDGAIWSDLQAIGAPVFDLDGDGYPNDTDNCPVVTQENQNDSNGNAVGDACEDMDDDGRIASDNCPMTYNPGQEDYDYDGIGDVCDDDRDGDAVANATDNCPAINNPTQFDGDGDEVGNACDDGYYTVADFDWIFGLPIGQTEYEDIKDGVTFHFSTTYPGTTLFNPFYSWWVDWPPYKFFSHFPEGVEITIEPPVSAIGLMMEEASCNGNVEFTGTLDTRRYQTRVGRTDTFIEMAEIGKIYKVTLSSTCDEPLDPISALFAVGGAWWDEMAFRPTTANLTGDLDDDGDVDKDDLMVLQGSLRQSADGAYDPRDLNGDGNITVLDLRTLAMACTRLRCATE